MIKLMIVVQVKKNPVRTTFTLVLAAILNKSA